ncbi:MAG: NAD(P)H-dependent glycerol-3-phosphate dehydrogenase [Candidatus Brocadiaceae bacterium]|jgi:glycerol-3-phosphate dehydrogenase (NAD(P)+)
MSGHPDDERSGASRAVSIIGCGGWGTALALLLDRKGHRVCLWGVEPDYVARMQQTRLNPRYLPELEIPRSIALTARMADCVRGSDTVVAATPTIYLRSVCERLAPHLRAGHLVVNVAKGIEEDTLLTGSEVIEDVCGDAFRLAGLYGPSHAEEVARMLPATVVATSRRADVAVAVQEAFMCPTFRVYTNTDVLGVELGAALKNVIAIAAGVCDGLGFGDNAKSALLTRGLAEITRLGVAMGARAETFAGLTGLGDLITTCVSPYGRNRSVGMRLARGETLEQITDQMDQVAEGVRTTRSACALADRHGVEMPIARAVYAVLFEGRDPRQAGMALMQREPKPEHRRATH